MLYDIWKVHYMTYAELNGKSPDAFQPERVARALSFEAAKQRVEELGFGYCMKPATLVPQ